MTMTRQRKQTKRKSRKTWRKRWRKNEEKHIIEQCISKTVQRKYKMQNYWEGKTNKTGGKQDGKSHKNKDIKN